MVYRKFSPKKLNFRGKFENLFELYQKLSRDLDRILQILQNGLSKIFAKMIENFVFEPDFWMAYWNFTKEIEQKFGNPINQPEQ